ncbi:hypothetical protein [Bradyrhizobium sp. USDA 313]|uniref:hypothetical protein n=1 Tax=Bradyrhizobium sp. USDA 313 TaxID=3156307 RepID=UPI0035174605
MLTDIGDGFCTFRDGWDDQKVADVVGVKKASVMGTRIECFGKLRQPPREQDHRLDEAIRAIENLQRCYDELKQRHDKLCDTLALNRVAEVRHLRVAQPNHSNGQQRPS